MICPSTLVVFLYILFILFYSTLADDQDVLLDLLPAFMGHSLQYQANNSNVVLSMSAGVSNLDARQLCDPGTYYCSGGCAPSGTTCCPDYYCPSNSQCCADRTCAPTGSQCCQGDTYCPSGYECCLSNCAPSGGVCCPDGKWCPAGNECIVDQNNGQHYCCTNPYCTAYVNLGGVTVQGYVNQGSGHNEPTQPPPTQSSLPTPAPATTTATVAPTTTPQPASPVYQYYYSTITWFYFSYYITYAAALPPSTPTSTLTYKTITTTTIISAYATNAEQATASLDALSATVSFETPAAATTALAQSQTVAVLPSAAGSTASKTSGLGPTGGVGSSASSAASGRCIDGKRGAGIAGLMMLIVLAVVVAM